MRMRRCMNGSSCEYPDPFLITFEKGNPNAA
jgi:hypothetical protein